MVIVPIHFQIFKTESIAYLDSELIPPTNFCCEEGVLTIDHEKTLQDLEGMAACFIA